MLKCSVHKCVMLELIIFVKSYSFLILSSLCTGFTKIILTLCKFFLFENKPKSKLQKPSTHSFILSLVPVCQAYSLMEAQY